MRRAEGVVDVHVGEPRQLLREAVVVGFLFRVEAQVFEQQGFARRQGIRHAVPRPSPTQSGASLHLLAEQLRQFLGHRRQTELGLGLALSGRPRCEASTIRAPCSRA